MTKEEMLEEAKLIVDLGGVARSQYVYASILSEAPFDHSIEEAFDTLYRELIKRNPLPGQVGYWYGRIVNPNRPDVCGGPR